METNEEMQAQIDALTTEVKALRRELDLIALVISRFGVADLRILNHESEILDRLAALDGKEQ